MTVHEDTCQIKLDVWASGSAANDGLAGSGYNATSTASKNINLPSGFTAQKQTAAANYISVPHGDKSNNYAHDNGSNMRGFKSFMDAGKHRRQESVAGHGKEDSGLAQYQDQQYRDVGHNRAEGYHDCRPGKINQLHGQG